MYSDIVDRKDSLQRLFDHAAELQKNGGIDLEVRSAFESYLCIRTYVFVETSVRTILLQHVRSVTSDDSTEKFVASQLERQPNLWYSELIKLVDRFNPEWKEKIKQDVTYRMLTSLNSLVRIRNRIAHSDNTDISLNDLQDYFSSSQEIIRIVFEVCSAGSTATSDS